MLPQDVDAIVRAEGASPIVFGYFNDAYAPKLLAYAIGGGRPLAALRAGPFARLLEKPCLKPALARAARGVLTPSCLRAVASGAEQRHFITLDRWGGNNKSDWDDSWYQTSRGGQNLVVQLGFPAVHDRAYRRLIRPRGDHPFVSESHPARTREPFTLGWARLDIDAEQGEVLIEEVQSDWVKCAHGCHDLATDWLAEGQVACLSPAEETDATAMQLLVYVERALASYARRWEEAVLAAALEFIYERLGLRRIYFHTWESGLVMKRLGSIFAPPRSLYTDLPKRFCFRKTSKPPRTLRHDPRTKSLEWNLLELC